MAHIVEATEYNLNLCRQALKNSQVISVPTETVYGLAGNALDEIAINAIYKIKERPLYNPLILHTDSIENAKKYGTFNYLAQKLANKFWPGPLTIILQKKEIVCTAALSGLKKCKLYRAVVQERSGWCTNVECLVDTGSPVTVVRPHLAQDDSARRRSLKMVGVGTGAVMLVATTATFKKPDGFCRLPTYCEPRGNTVLNKLKADVLLGTDAIRALKLDLNSLMHGCDGSANLRFLS